MSKLQAIIFDWDGVFSPSDKKQGDWFQHWAKVNNKPFPEVLKDPKSFMTFFNYHLHKSGPQGAYDELNLPCDMEDKSHPVWEAWQNHSRTYLVGLYPEMKETLQEIVNMGKLTEDAKRNKKLKFAINSNNTWKNIHPELKAENLLPYFDSQVTVEVMMQYQGSDNIKEIQKPSRISLALSLNLLNTEAKRTLHVGDTRNDLIASYQVVRNDFNTPENLITVGAAWGFEGRKVLEQGAKVKDKHIYFDHIADKPNELIDIVKKYL